MGAEYGNVNVATVGHQRFKADMTELMAEVGGQNSKHFPHHPCDPYN